MKKKFGIIGCCLGWFAVIVQLFLMIQNRQADIPETIIRFFSFFTILTNILVALYFTINVFHLKGSFSKLFSAGGSITAITTFILIVGLVYQFILRQIWEPKGMQMIVDELLHTIIPLYMLVYWFFNIQKDDLILKNLFYWLLYPVIYLVAVMLRGYFSHYYPYPFLNVDQLGLQIILKNIGLIIIFTLIVMTILWLIGKFRTQKLNKI